MNENNNQTKIKFIQRVGVFVLDNEVIKYVAKIILISLLKYKPWKGELENVSEIKYVQVLRQNKCS
jgi:hypothetical protein